MPNWKKVIVSGSNAILSNITASGDISASGDIYATNFIGTSSLANVAVSSSALLIEINTNDVNYAVPFTNANNNYGSIYTDSKPHLTYNPSTNTLKVGGIIDLSGSIDFKINPSNNSDLIISGTNTLDIPVGGGGSLNILTSSLFEFYLANRAQNINIGTTAGSAVNLGANNSVTTVYNFTAAGSNIRATNLPSNTVNADSVVMWESSTGYFYYTASDALGGGNQNLQQVTEQGSSTTIPITASAYSGSYIDFDVIPDANAPDHKEGRVYYNTEDGALTVYNNEADISLQVGQEFWIRVKNNSGDDILNGTPVRISGSQGDRPKIYPATAEDHTENVSFDNHIAGIATHDILDTEEGYITAQGIVRGIDTSNFAAGDILYLQTGSPANPEDYYRNTPPPFPYDIIQAGYVARSADPNGFIFAEPKEPTHFNNISGLSGSYNAHVGDLWVYQPNKAWTHTKNLSGSYTIEGGNLTVEGDIIAQQYIVNSTVTNVTMSFSSGSTIFGDSLDDTHLFTGSVDITGSLKINTNTLAPNTKLTVGEGGIGIVGTGTTNAYRINDIGGTSRHALYVTSDTNALYVGNTNYTGGVYVPTNITASGNISASGDIIGDELILSTHPTQVGFSSDPLIDISLNQAENYKLGVVKRFFDLGSPSNIDGREIAILNSDNFSKGYFHMELRAEGYNQGDALILNTSSIEQDIIINRDTNNNFITYVGAQPEYTIYAESTAVILLYQGFTQTNAQGQIIPFLEYDEADEKLKLNFIVSTSAGSFYNNSNVTVILKYEIYST